LRLSELIKGSNGNGVEPAALADVDIAGIAADSREVKPGFLFAALPGNKLDGRDFVADAIRRGAVAVLAPPGLKLRGEQAPIRVIPDSNPRRRLARMAARFYGGQPRTIAAVTGTNGKTSTAEFTRQIWTLLGERAASLGTLGLRAPDRPAGPSLTTPDPVVLHRTLAELDAADIQHLAMEASSHGLDQSRLDGVHIAAAAFTNLTRDHLDYHGTLDAYFAAKRLLFERVMGADGTAVLNRDIPEYAALADTARARRQRIIGYGTAEGAELRLVRRTPMPDGQRLDLTIFGQPIRVELPLAGAFQAMNALAALGLAIGGGAEPLRAAAQLARLAGVPGRLELVARHPNGAPVYVDYAHTPDALATVLNALRPHAAGDLVVVFGCGGDRDAGKRPQMGMIACELADRVIVTDDNPRGEVPAKIRSQILAACARAEEIGDRTRAIGAAVAGLAQSDALVIAGKGHEQGQIVGAEVRPFDDATVARQAVAALGGDGR
jgi:UDP-N-acetylmuramoyl-L-alanyl-D-glutamate--2,6-diaminopimelate ligase